MDYCNNSNKETQEFEMEAPFVRSGQGQENINAQYNTYSQYSNSNQPAPYRNTGAFGGRGFYKSQAQQDNGMQYGNTGEYEYEDSLQSAPAQYMDNSNQRGGSQYNYKAQTAWKMQQNFVPEQDYYRSGSATPNPSTMIGSGNKGYQKGGHWAGQTEDFSEHQGAYSKDTRGRGRGKGGNIGSGPNFGGRGRGTYNYEGSSNMGQNSTFNAFEGRKNMRGGMKPARGGYQKPESEGKPFQSNTGMQPFDSITQNEPMAVDYPKKVNTSARKPQVEVPPKFNSPQVTSSTEDANSNKCITIFQKSAQLTSVTAPDSKQETEQNDVKHDARRKMPWKLADGGVRKRKKKTPAEKNLKVKKYVQPKNAVMCLNELVQGVVYSVEQESNESTSPVCISVEVNGQKYRGFGSSKQMAKQAAAEAALVSFVKPPTSDTASEDNTPWTVLACFAMFKLFNEWREGRIGMCHPGFSGGTPFGVPMVQDATMSQSIQNMLGSSTTTTADGDKPQMSSVLAAYLGCKDQKRDDSKQVPNPARQVPENAASMHPVMLLHQMRPQLVYTQSSVIKENQQLFTLSCVIDDHTFFGEGSNLKKAKLELALKANKQLFDVQSTYQAN